MRPVVRHVTTMLAAGALLAAGCSSSDDDGAGGDELRDVDEVRAQRAVSGEVGDVLEADGIAVTVTSMRVGGDDSGPWLEVDVRVENREDSDTWIP